jgi:hypothetical protein
VRHGRRRRGDRCSKRAPARGGVRAAAATHGRAGSGRWHEAGVPLRQPQPPRAGDARDARVVGRDRSRRSCLGLLRGGAAKPRALPRSAALPGRVLRGEREEGARARRLQVRMMRAWCERRRVRDVRLALSRRSSLGGSCGDAGRDGGGRDDGVRVCVCRGWRVGVARSRMKKKTGPRHRHPSSAPSLPPSFDSRSHFDRAAKRAHTHATNRLPRS